MSGNDDEREFWRGQTAWIDLHDEMDAILSPLDALILPEARPGMSVLEVGCGAGGTTSRILERLSPGGTLRAVDISEPFVEAARARVPGADIRLADAQSDDLGGPYDAVLSRLGVMFFSDPAEAFANLRRAMRPGARLAAVAWGPARENPWFSLPSRVATAVLGRVDPVPADAPGPFGFSDPDRPARALEAAGFGDVSVERAELTLDAPAPEARAALQMRIGPVGRIMRAHPPTDDQRRRIEEGIAEEMRALGEVPAVMHLIRASA